ncbi:MAG TPA: nuclear transport factor 2 family protein [Candidatus Binatia bacterium]|nr:nuclear transport factor 2 family protein [Candidatus Binatia bacterium]
MTATLEERIAIARAHAAAERRGDLEATLATLDPDPLYELLPVGRAFRGMDAARRYYEHFFANFRPLARASEMHAEWANEVGVAQEYTIHLHLADGSEERHRLIAILTFGKEKLSGERVYASDRLLRLMFGPAYDLAI